jgi:hypothetical protein
MVSVLDGKVLEQISIINRGAQIRAGLIAVTGHGTVPFGGAGPSLARGRSIRPRAAF